MRSPNAGKPKVKIYHYDENGKYIKYFTSQSEVFKTYFDGKKGRLIELNKDYRELPDGTFVSRYRIGREGLRKAIRIDNCVFCSKNATDRAFSAYNYLGEKVASFINMRVCTELTGIPVATIHGSLTNSKRSTPHNGLVYRYD